MAHNEVAGRQPWLTYAAWTAIGTALSLGILSVYSVGMKISAITVGCAAVLALSSGLRGAASGLLAGLAVPAFYIAFANRQGPGWVCTSSGSGQSCADKWSPWPWFLVGVLLVAASVWLFEHPARRDAVAKHRSGRLQKLLHHGRTRALH